MHRGVHIVSLCVALGVSACDVTAAGAGGASSASTGSGTAQCHTATDASACEERVGCMYRSARRFRYDAWTREAGEAAHVCVPFDDLALTHGPVQYQYDTSEGRLVYATPGVNPPGAPFRSCAFSDDACDCLAGGPPK